MHADDDIDVEFGHRPGSIRVGFEIIEALRNHSNQ